jgi:hypothetical protein
MKIALPPVAMVATCQPAAAARRLSCRQRRRSAPASRSPAPGTSSTRRRARSGQASVGSFASCVSAACSAALRRARPHNDVVLPPILFMPGPLQWAVRCVPVWSDSAAGPSHVQVGEYFSREKTIEACFAQSPSSASTKCRQKCAGCPTAPRAAARLTTHPCISLLLQPRRETARPTRAAGRAYDQAHPPRRRGQRRAALEGLCARLRRREHLAPERVRSGVQECRLRWV